jgi:hypothetical protein
VVAWIDENGVVHINWVYEPGRLLGPVISGVVDRSLIADLRSASEVLSLAMGDLVDQLASELEMDHQPTTDLPEGHEIPEDLVIETSEPNLSLPIQVANLVAQAPARWRAEVLQAINEVIHDRIDDISGGDGVRS